MTEESEQSAPHDQKVTRTFSKKNVLIFMRTFSKKDYQMDNRYQGIVQWKSVTTKKFSATSNVHSNECYFVPRKDCDRRCRDY